MPSVQFQPSTDAEDDVTESQRRHRDAVRPPSSPDPRDCAPLELPCLMPVSTEPLRQGVKHDIGKPRWSLLPTGPIRSIVEVMGFGARKYAEANWQLVAKGPGGRERYYDAAMRHLTAYNDGERFDRDSGLPTLAHAACCLVFLLWLDEQPEER